MIQNKSSSPPVPQVYLAQGLFQAEEGLLTVFGLELAFPDGDGVPAELAEVYAALEVTGLVAGNFVLPEPGVGFGEDKVAAVGMAVPEASVDEDCRAVFAEYYIGSTGKFLYIEAVPESVGKEEAAHKKLRFGVLAADALHAFVALLRIQLIWHKEISLN